MKSSIQEIIARTEGWCSFHKAETLYDLVIKSNAKISVEIGVFGGRGAMAMAMAHKDMNWGVCYGIDPWATAPCLEGSNTPENDEWWSKLDIEKIYRGFLIQLLAFDVSEFLYILRMKSDVAIRLFDKISVLHFDGNHSEEISCKDVELYAPLVTDYIVFDDTNWETTRKAQSILLNYGFKEIYKYTEPEGGEWKVFEKIK